VELYTFTPSIRLHGVVFS